MLDRDLVARAPTHPASTTSLALRAAIWIFIEASTPDVASTQPQVTYLKINWANSAKFRCHSGHQCRSFGYTM